MITLGLSRTVSGPWPQPKTVGAASQGLVETAAWCSRCPLQHNQLRSLELDPSVFFKVPSLDEIGVEAWLDIRRRGYQLAIDNINRRRSALLRDTNAAIDEAAVVEWKGRLLLYEPLETVSCGAAEASSQGFFDSEDAPPWDTWFLYSQSTIFSFIPEPLVQYAQAGIDANPVDCIRWADWSRLSGR